MIPHYTDSFHSIQKSVVGVWTEITFFVPKFLNIRVYLFWYHKKHKRYRDTDILC